MAACIVHWKIWQKNNGNITEVPVIIKDGSGGRFSQLYQQAFGDQQYPSMQLLTRSAFLV